MDDINLATYKRKVESVISPQEQARLIANFANLTTASERVDAFRALSSGKLVAGASTKLGSIQQTS